MDNETFSIRDVIGLSQEHTDLLISELNNLARTEKTAMSVIAKFAEGHNKESVMRGVMLVWYTNVNDRVACEARHDD